MMNSTASAKASMGLRPLPSLSGAVRCSEILGLIGPNGAGKTTFFHAATGFVRPDRGSIVFRGHSLVGHPPYKIARLGIARTFQELRLIRRLSVLENVLLAFPNQPGERLWNVFFRWRTVSAREREIRRAVLDCWSKRASERKQTTRRRPCRTVSRSC